MPVHNEAACIEAVLRGWIAVLDPLGIPFHLVALDDGSTDRTPAILDALAADPRLEVIHHSNRGHGPTILAGYQRAVSIAAWVFQCDSDDEIQPEHFPPFWAARVDFDAVVGVRVGRQQRWDRRLISRISRLVVRLYFGRAVADVNCPFRLIRSPALQRIAARIPPDTFAPNVLLSGALARTRARVLNLPVPHRHRRTGSVSITNLRLWKAALRSLWQTLRWHPDW
jgi:dolichol-phosphate mannosyltransferase